MNSTLQCWFGSELPLVGRCAMLGLLAGGMLVAHSARAQGQGWVGQCDYATPYTFTTIAGSNSIPGWVNGSNSVARFGWPQGIKVATNGVVYLVDAINNDVRQMTHLGTNWAVTTIAGTDGNQFGPADGTNGSIQFDTPVDLAIDPAGNLYVADFDNNSVRKLTLVGTNWVSSTIATGLKFPSGIAVDAATNVYVADTYNNVIRKLSPAGAAWSMTTIAGTISATGGAGDGTNDTAQFNQPAGLAVDQAGNLFVGDTGNYAVREITPVGTNWVVTTIAGTLGNGPVVAVDGTNGDATFNSPIAAGPMAIAVDTNDNLYVADAGNSLIRKISRVGTNWVTTTLAGLSGNAIADGTGTNAGFGLPQGIAVDSGGRLFVTDADASDIREGTVAPTTPTAPPNPSITRAGVAGGVTVWWPGSGYTLQTNANLATTNWGVYGGTINLNNGTNSVTVPSPTGRLFFRLSE